MIISLDALPFPLQKIHSPFKKNIASQIIRVTCVNQEGLS